MGKYMKKAKLITGEVAVMEVANQSILGVRTRARTLALQRLQPDPPSYLQLRSRRLQKPNPNPNPSSPKCSPASKPAVSEVNYSSVKASTALEPENDGGVEGSFGENVLELEATDRNHRETTPCSLIRDPETITTPGSTTRPANSTIDHHQHRRAQHSTHTNIPTALEMDEFFAAAEKIQHRIFTEKYNFDPAKDSPLPGRYEWVKLDS